MSGLSRGFHTPRPTCPNCGGGCSMFVEHGRRGDFQVIHCNDTDDCAWYWVPDGAQRLPEEGPQEKRSIFDMVQQRAYSQTQAEREKVTHVLAGRIAGLLDSLPDIYDVEVYLQRIKEKGRLTPLTQLAYAIRNSRALCKCLLTEGGRCWKNEKGEIEESDIDSLDFDDPDNHDARCPVGAAKRIIADALTVV